MPSTAFAPWCCDLGRAEARGGGGLGGALCRGPGMCDPSILTWFETRDGWAREARVQVGAER